MGNWEELMQKLKETNKQAKQAIEEGEASARIMSAIIKKRNELGLSQRDLAKLCKIPQSTVARIEKLTVSPTVDTLFKILSPLGLTLTVSEIH